MDDRPDEADTVEAALAISETLRGLGYQSDLVHVGLDMTPIEDMARRQPLAVFNLVEAINADFRLQPMAPAIYERLRIPYTGCSFDAIVSAMSKTRSKHVMKAAAIATPVWIDGIRNPLPADTTVLVKSDSEHASIGIDSSSVVMAGEAQRVIREREAKFGGRFFAEVFIEGREFNVAMVEGPDGPQALPIPEIQFIDYPDGKPRIVDYDAKWMVDSFAYANTPRAFGIEARITLDSRRATACAVFKSASGKTTTTEPSSWAAPKSICRIRRLMIRAPSNCARGCSGSNAKRASDNPPPRCCVW